MKVNQPQSNIAIQWTIRKGHLNFARNLNLDVIPLVQTFGHMEWLLKYERFRKFRENDKFPQFGVCEESQKVMQDLLEEQPLIMYPQYDSLAFWHIARIANYTHRVTKGARILAWHDMINRITITKFTDSTTGEILEPQLYKTPMAPNVEGIIITGWSRYDHMAGLCEILPIGIPSMVVNTQIALMGSKRQFDATGKELIIQQAYEAAGSLMKCSIYGEPYNTCQFPGKLTCESLKILGYLRGHEVFDLYLENDVQNVLFNVIQGVPTQLQQLETNLLRLFHKDTVDEFFFSNVDPILKKIRHLVESSSRLSQKRTYGRRPFKIKRLNFANLTQELLSLVNPPTS
ncbi:unnamed protein product [Nippostrongylus brasiliensis]|uniref:Beta-N-acetylhexosaminidase n=1 Tax=Nippostrongylus brasiliensis TaxID=27835 RepID=A0A0N4Y0J4_NIPBR|nr:unnamed protein product [Nippostrongylus brasiliensis]